MKRLNIIKKAVSVICVLTVMLMALPIGNYVSALSGVYVSISAPSNYNPKAGESISFTLNYTGDVSNIWLTSGGVVLNGFTANKSITGTGNTRTVTLSNIQGTGTGKSVSITGGTAVSSEGDLANAVRSAYFNIAAATPVDSKAPVLAITGPSVANITAGQTVSFTANYTDDVGVSSIWLTGGGVVLNGFTANKSVTGTGNSRTITLSNVQGSAGTKSITITGGTAVDAAGNLANAATSSVFNLNAVVVDSKPPVLAITGPNPNTIKAGQTVTFTATYTDDIGISNIWLTSGGIVTNGFTGNLTISGTGNIRTLTFVNVQGALGGNKTISITGGTAVDAAGNLANAATSAAFSIVAPNVPTEPTKPTKPVEKPEDWIPNPNTGK